MGSNIRQKRKARSSRSVVRQSNSRKRPLNPTGNAIIAENWDKHQTLTQNYRRLGLTNRLNHATGGIERLGTDVVSARRRAQSAQQATVDLLRIDGRAGLLQGSAAGVATRAATAAAVAAGGVREVRVERDAAGKIVRVVQDAPADAELDEARRPLSDLLSALDDDDDDDDDDEWTGLDAPTAAPRTAPTAVVSALEAAARKPVGPRHVRHQSEAERAWLQGLVAHYGTATPDEATLAAMARDRRRNPMQRTAADLGRRLASYRA